MVALRLARLLTIVVIVVDVGAHDAVTRWCGTERRTSGWIGLAWYELKNVGKSINQTRVNCDPGNAQSEVSGEAGMQREEGRVLVQSPRLSADCGFCSWTQICKSKVSSWTM